MTRVIGAMFRIMAVGLRTDPAAGVLIVVLVAANTGGIAFTALSQRWLVDSASHGLLPSIMVAAALGATAHALISVFQRVQANLQADLSAKAELTLTKTVLEQAARIPRIDHLEHTDYLDRLATLRSGAYTMARACWHAVDALASIVGLAISIFLLTGVHPALSGLIALAVVPLVLARRGDRRLHAVLDEAAHLLRRERHLHDLCLQPGPAKEIRIAGSGDFLDSRAAELWTRATGRELRARSWGGAWQFLGWVIFTAGYVTAIAIASRLVIDGTASIGDIVLVITLGSRLQGQVSTTIGTINHVVDGRRLLEHYLWLTDLSARSAQAGRTPPDVLTSGIALDGVSYTYPGASSPTLREVHLQLPAGATIGLVGLNGAGKSTLVKLLLGLYAPTTGTLSVDGVSMSDLSPSQWAARSAGTFQDFAKPQLVAREAIGAGHLPKIGDTAAVRRAIDGSGAGQVIDSLAEGLETQLGHVFDGVELSQGQWQKIALARGQMRTEPLLFVFDEPTAALDPQAEHELFERFTRHAHAVSAGSGAITVLVSHRFSNVHMTDLIVVVDGGEIIEQGTHAELLALEGTYADLYRTQARGYQ